MPIWLDIKEAASGGMGPHGVCVGATGVSFGPLSTIATQKTHGKEAVEPTDDSGRDPNAGRVFKNPPGDSAGRLVQAAGLKGAREGAAAISELHGNFIVNEGGATATDVRKLIERVMTEVKRRFGIQIEPEVEMVGRWK